MPYRFIHTADLHLDSPLRSLALRDEALARAVDVASREAFRAIVDRALEERVDAVMIAGDLYDGTETSMKTALFLAGQVKRLDEAGIRAFIVRGNHDAKAQITKSIELPPSAHLFDGRGGDGEIAREAGEDGPEVRVHGISFRDAKAPDSLLPRYGAPSEGAVDIGLMHTSLAGDGAHDPYAPCRLADLVGHGYAYWGLGHIHARTVHHHEGPTAVVMAGMPQGRHIGEAGPKGATLVNVLDDGTIDLEAFTTCEVEFARVDCALGPETGWDDALDRAEATLLGAADTAAPRMVARIDLSGSSHAAWLLNRDRDEFADKLRERLEGGNVHLEAVRGRVREPETKMAALPGAGGQGAEGLVGELVAGMERAVGEPDFGEWAHEHAARLARALHPEARNALLGMTAESTAEAIETLVEDGLANVAARLRGVAAGGRADGAAQGASEAGEGAR